LRLEIGVLNQGFYIFFIVYILIVCCDRTDIFEMYQVRYATDHSTDGDDDDDDDDDDDET